METNSVFIMITSALSDQTLTLINVQYPNEHIAIHKRTFSYETLKQNVGENFSRIQYTSVYLKDFY